jgi:tetratricopeptide (TPR) repeat protein
LELALALSGRDVDRLLDLVDCHLDLKEFDVVDSLCDEIHEESNSKRVHQLEATFFRTSASHQSGKLSLDESREALEALLATGEDFPHRMQAYFQLVRATDRSGDPARARMHAKAIRRAGLSSLARNRAGYVRLATSYVISRYGDPRRSLVSLQEALLEAQRISDWELESIVRQGFGAVLRQVGRFADSVQQIRYGLEFARKTLNPQAEATALNDLAVTEIDLGQFSDAKEHLEHAARIDQIFPRWPMRAYRMSNEGVLHYHRGNYDESIRTLRISLDFATEHDVWAIQLAAHGMLAMCAVRLGSQADLEEHARWLQAELPTRLQLVPSRGPTEAALAWYLAASGNPGDATSKLERACRYLQRRDMAHWMFARLELIRLRERYDGVSLAADRRNFHDVCAKSGAQAMARQALEQ